MYEMWQMKIESYVAYTDLFSCIAGTYVPGLIRLELIILIAIKLFVLLIQVPTYRIAILYPIAINL